MLGDDFRRIEIVEVGPRDGFQGISQFIPTETKIRFVERLFDAGIHRIEVGSFVSPRAVPQLADTPQVLEASRQLSGLAAQVLVPNEKYGRAAVEAGADVLAFVVSASETHNMRNIRLDHRQSVEAYRRLVDMLTDNVRLRLNIATAFDCPFEGRMDDSAVLSLLDVLAPMRPDVELGLCDTTGRATPEQVGTLFEKARKRLPAVKNWALHAHDTYGLGLANVFAAWRTGVRIFDASFAGLGGCPFAPGATGNVATEDVTWMFSRMGVDTSIDLDELLAIAREGASIPGGTPGGRVRQAFTGGMKARFSQVTAPAET